MSDLLSNFREQLERSFYFGMYGIRHICDNNFNISVRVQAWHLSSPSAIHPGDFDCHLNFHFSICALDREHTSKVIDHSIPCHDQSLLYFKNVLAELKVPGIGLRGDIYFHFGSEYVFSCKFHLNDIHTRGHYFVVPCSSCLS